VSVVNPSPDFDGWQEMALLMFRNSRRIAFHPGSLRESLSSGLSCRKHFSTFISPPLQPGNFAMKEALNHFNGFSGRANR
jgi:hypothetical protein